jgi:hypothetical protein
LLPSSFTATGDSGGMKKVLSKRPRKDLKRSNCINRESR